MAQQKLIARPSTIKKAIQAIESKGPVCIEHVYDKIVSQENDRRCLEKLHQILSSSRAEQRRQC